jgi:DNA-binding MarR family transcriptional regulator
MTIEIYFPWNYILRNILCSVLSIAQWEIIVTPPSRIQWLTDLIRLEIALWERINVRLKQEHTLPLAAFEALYFIGHSPDSSLRVGDLAHALRITVGATSKLVDRIEATGLLRREVDADDRRATRLVLTASGRHTLAAASTTYETEIAMMLDATLSQDEQELLHNLVTRLLTATNHGEPT